MSSLPQSIQDRIEAQAVRRVKAENVLKELTNQLVAKRKHYVEGRAGSGIEEVWMKCDSNMAGIDEITGMGSAVVPPRYTKGMTLTDGIRRNDDSATRYNGKSRAFERLTPRYVAAGAAKLSSITTSVDAKLFSIDCTPNADLVEIANDPQMLQINGQQAKRDPKPTELMPPNPTDPLSPPQLPPGSTPAAMPGVPLTTKDLAEEQQQEAHKKAKKAEEILYDWQTEAKYQKHVRKMFYHAARYGTGVMKGPFPEVRRSRAVTKGDDESITLEFKEEIKPGFKAISPWDCFPDPDAGEDIQEGEGFFERDRVIEKQLKALAKEDGYFSAEIAEAIKEGPNKSESSNSGPNDHQTVGKNRRFELWYYTGALTQDEAEAINACLGLPDRHALRLPLGGSINVTVTMVNDRIIKCVKRAPLESGQIPYRFLPWEFREGSPWGIGVAEQCFLPQDMINSALRAMGNNASAGAQIVINKSLVTPADQSPVLYANKMWHMAPDATVDDIRKVFGIFAIPNVTKEMLEIVMHAYLVAENSTNIPLITQGHSGKTSPATYGQAQLQDDNANQLLRDVAGRYDDYVGEPNVQDLYEWLMLDPDIDSNAKGDFQISAKGAAGLAERYIQDQYIATEYPMVTNPAFGINPKKWYAQLRRSKKLNPEDVQYTEEEQQKLAQVPPPKPPQVQAAEIRAQVDMERAKMQQDRDTVYVQAEAQRTQGEHQARMQELHTTLQIAIQKAQIEMEKIKAQIAETTMKLKVQQDLSSQSNAHDLHKQVLMPPSEPAGKAPAGRAYEQ